MLTKFSTSTNIIRDRNVTLDYIVTPNAKNIVNQLISDFQTGLHSFSIIGSYGTGKSSFIWAFENNISKDKNFFFKLNGQFGNKSDFEIINIVGSYTPLAELLGKEVGAKVFNSNTILDQLEKKYNQTHSKGKLLLIVIDEFGKLLEFAAANNPEESMYFIQQLAEFCNDSSRDILLITTLHQNFGAYADQLTYNQKQEWIKVKGRFKEISFNEPIEQLLFLASKRIKSWKKNTTNNLKYDDIIFSLAAENYLLSHGVKSNPKLAAEIFPLEIIAASVLTRALQKYGQNERSLFTYLNDRSEGSLYEYFHEDKTYTLIDVFEFIYNNFFSFLVTTLNEDKNYWDALRSALSRSTSVFKEDFSVGEVIIKTIGLLNILGEPGGHISKEFIVEYCKIAGYNKTEIEYGIDLLSTHKIIYYRNFANRYVLTEGTDLNYEAAINKASEKINPDLELVTALQEFFVPGVENPRRNSLETGTSRFIEYALTQRPIDFLPKGEIDGIINIVLSDNLTIEDTITASKNCVDAILYIYFPNIKILKNTILEIEKIRIVIRENLHDKVAENELKIREENEIRKLNKSFNNALFDSNKEIKWFYQGKEIVIRNKKDLNIKLSEVCDTVYKNTPILKNELFNKHKYSSQISTARKKYIKQLLEAGNQKLIGFPENKYPPEKAIYLSMLYQTGIHRKEETGDYTFGEPTEDNFKKLWELSLEFLEQAKLQKVSISTFIDLLYSRPFKLKQGFIDFWIPTFLIIKQDEYALFNENNYVPFITPDLMDLIWKNPEKAFVKTYNVNGVKLELFNKYRDLINLRTEDTIDQKAFLNTIKPFLIFYRDLPDYSKKTKNISASAIELRNAISSSPDPETAFFQEFPKALGFDPDDLISDKINLDKYVIGIQNAIREIRSSFDDLITRFEGKIKSIADLEANAYEELKAKLISRFNNIDADRLAASPKKLLSRIRTPYEKRIDFFNSLSYALIDKSLEELNDNDEPILYQSYKNQYESLESVLPIHELNKDRTKGKIIGLDITNPDGRRIKKHISFNNNGFDNTEEIELKISKITRDASKEDKIRLYFKLLKEELEDES